LNSISKISSEFKLFWLLFIVLFSSGYVFFKVPFEFYFHYIFFLTLLPIWVLRYGIPKIIIKLLFIPLIIGLVHIGLGNNNPFTFFKIFGGLSITIMFFYHFLIIKDFDFKKLFSWYIKFCYFLVLIGTVQVISFLIDFEYGYNFNWILNKWSLVKGGIVGIRVNSILSEPTYLATVVSPLVYISVKNLISKSDLYIKKYQSILVIVISILTTSSIGFFGILLSLLLATNTIRLRYLFIGLFISISGFLVTYNNVPDFRARVDSAFGLWIEDDFSAKNTNNSSFVLYNNLHIALEGLKNNPLFGTGLGSHEVAFKNYTLTKSVIKYDFEFNIKDGNSLFIRLCTETGLLGLVFILLLTIRCFIYRVPSADIFQENKIISQSIFVLLILTLIRQGNYMLNGLPLMFIIYYYNYIDYKNLKLMHVSDDT
tara:strand:+ start:263 stop:1543 length:1281 start_codon:yes stop_codon:yes gene_type:complete